MVLVNTLTVEAINTALIALQRGQSIVVGGEKGTTVNNITISNSGGGSSGGLDFSPQINALDKRVGLLEKAEEVLRLENERQEERITALEGLGISDFFFDETSRDLTIELQNGETFETTITSESFSMYIDNGELVIKIGNQERRVPVSQGVQADWTETDSSDPSFIKNKIPIWITDGSADDNMSPIDSITDGEMRPPTSNAVYDKHYLTSADITNEVTVDNMQSVSSNAVAQAISKLGWSYTEVDTGKKWLGGEKIYKMCFEQAVTGATYAGNIIQLSFLPNVIVSLSGLVHSSSFCFPLGQWNSNTLFSYITFNRSTRRLYAEVDVSGAGIQAFSIYVEMEYCK